MAAPQLVSISGTVSRVNDKGFQMQEDPGVWRNISQFAKPAPELPAVGALIVCGLDNKGFVRTIEPMGPRAIETAGTVPPVSPKSHDATLPRAVPSKDTTITRLACLHAATRYLAPRADAKAGDILRVAASLEAWVLR